MRRVRTLKSQCLLYTVFPTASPSSSSASLHGGDGLRSMVAPQRCGDSEAAARPERRPRLHSALCPPAAAAAPRARDRSGIMTGSCWDRTGTVPRPARPGPPLRGERHPRSRSTRGSQGGPFSASTRPPAAPRRAVPRPGRMDARSEENSSQENFFIWLYKGRCDRSGALP